MAEYIEREAALALVRPDAPEDEKTAVTIATAKKLVRSIVRRTPAADVAPMVHARWIEKSAPARKIYFECSHCGAQENKHTAIKGYYCWRCGAKMDGDDNGSNDCVVS